MRPSSSHRGEKIEVTESRDAIAGHIIGPGRMRYALNDRSGARIGEFGEVAPRFWKSLRSQQPFDGEVVFDGDGRAFARVVQRAPDIFVLDLPSRATNRPLAVLAVSAAVALAYRQLWRPGGGG